MTYNIIISPPVAFLVVLVFVMILSSLLARLSFKPKSRDTGERASYACGEDVKDHRTQPDYSQFFPFAFFFTVLHVVTLMLATVPVESMDTFVIAIVYIACAISGLVIVFRR